MQHVIDHFLLAGGEIARMADTETQAPEIAAAETIDNVLEAVVAAGAAAQFDLSHARRKIEFVMHNQNVAWCNLVKRGECRYRAA